MAQPTITIDEQDAMIVRTPDFITPWRHVSEYLTNSADSNNMAVDGSGGSPQAFSYTPPDTYNFVAERMMMFMQCSSAMTTTVFGNLAAALGQGIEIKVAGVLITVWRDNIDIYTEYYDVDTLSNVSNAVVDTTLHGRWTFCKDTNSLGLIVPNGQFFESIVNDDLSSITQLRMRIKGKLIQAI